MSILGNIADKAAFAFDVQGEFALASGYGITMKPDVSMSMKFMLGLLNSRLLDWHWKRISTPLQGGFFRYFTQFVAQLPVVSLDLQIGSERAEHNAIVKLVEKILVARRSSPVAGTSALEREIDERVYKLYGLTKDEIKIVEEGR